MASPDTPDHAVAQSMQRELRLFALYRGLEAALLALLVFSPAGSLLGEPHAPLLAAVVAVAYLLAAAGLVIHAHRLDGPPFRGHVLVAVAIDLTVALLATHALPGAGAGIALMMVFNVAAASLFLELRTGIVVAAAATAALFIEYVWWMLDGGGDARHPGEIMMYVVGYFASVALIHELGRQMRRSQELADRRGAEAASLTEINDMVIRRMRTGVLLVDGSGVIGMANEAAALLLCCPAENDGSDAPGNGNGSGEAGAEPPAPEEQLHGRSLPEIAPEIGMRLAQWLRTGLFDDTPMVYGPEDAEILPRFTRLQADSDAILIFLDDTSLLSRRAELITLAAMGRFSASLAHEIRNPLAAINYATQLLEESESLGSSDRRLLQIIHQQCMRTNGIVESVLGLARRERASPGHIELTGFIDHFIDDYRMITPEENAQVRASHAQSRLPGVFDARHLQQILTALVNNAVRYGRLPGETARITLRSELQGGAPTISVLDRGPGIPEAVAVQLFRPFFTTSESGTGLGLYIAQELCRANEATLDYVPVPGGGACFRITLSPHGNRLVSAGT